jgi:uncharacterized protein (DUF779 family)
MVERVVATKSARALIDRLRRKHGPVMFHQSAGGSEGLAAYCLLPGEWMIGDADLLVGTIVGCPFYVSTSEYAHWQYTQFIIDVIDARRGACFSLEGPEGISFRTRSRRLSTEEWTELSTRPLQ